MKKEILVVVGITFLFLGLSLVPLTQGTKTRESISNYKELNSILKFYRLNLDSTIGEFENLLYKLVIKKDNRNPSLKDELKSNIQKLSVTLRQIGITEDMTISQSLPLIENNKGIFQELGINLFCSVSVRLIGGSSFPHNRFIKVFYGEWRCLGGYPYGPHTVKINSKLIGLQYCEDGECGAQSGEFIGLIGIPPVMIYIPAITTPMVGIRGNFVLFSHSGLPFV
jgi:hypothetical protein